MGSGKLSQLFSIERKKESVNKASEKHLRRGGVIKSKSQNITLLQTATFP